MSARERNERREEHSLALSRMLAGKPIDGSPAPEDEVTRLPEPPTDEEVESSRAYLAALKEDRDAG